MRNTRDRGCRDDGYSGRANSIESVLLDSIDQALADLFGAAVRQAFYGYFNDRFGLERETIALRLDKFAVALSETFGVAGVLVLGRAIAKRLYTNLGLPFNEQPNYTLLDYVKEAKMILFREAELDSTTRHQPSTDFSQCGTEEASSQGQYYKGAHDGLRTKPSISNQ